MRLPAEKVLDAILNAPHPLPLVHSFAEEDLYLLLNEIGHEDALPLISLASNRQWEYLIDMDVWQEDRLDTDALTVWIGLLLKADARRLMEWSLNQKAELLELYLFKHVDIRIREHDQDPADFGPDYTTVDGTVYVRISRDPLPAGSKKAKNIHKQRSLILTHFLNFLAAFDYNRYFSLLMEARGVIPAESEEDLLRRRNVRLAEKGFLPFDEAVGIYTPLGPDNLDQKDSRPRAVQSGESSFYPAPFYASRLLKEASLFSRSLATIDTAADLQQIQSELAALCNQIISADRLKVANRQELKQVVQKAAAYLSIGLDRLAASPSPKAPKTSSTHLCHYPLSQIFRVGYQAGLTLKWKAEKWYRLSWCKRMALPLSFWDEQGMGLIGGLLLKKPLFFDSGHTEQLYREFHSAEEITATDKHLQAIMALDDLLSQIPMKLQPGGDHLLTFKKLLLTLWGRHHLKLPQPQTYTPLSLEEYKFLHGLLFRAPVGSGSHAARPPEDILKESFLAWLKDQTGMPMHDLSARLARSLENLFDELTQECGRVAPDRLDPRFIRLLAVSA